MAFLKKKDGSWNVPLIMALVVALLALLGGAYGMYYVFFADHSRVPVPVQDPVGDAFEGFDAESYFATDSPLYKTDL